MHFGMKVERSFRRRRGNGDRAPLQWNKHFGEKAETVTALHFASRDTSQGARIGFIAHNVRHAMSSGGVARGCRQQIRRSATYRLSPLFCPAEIAPKSQQPDRGGF
jgi:hypothetical protein